MTISINRMSANPYHAMAKRPSAVRFGAKDFDPLQGKPPGFRNAVEALGEYYKDLNRTLMEAGISTPNAGYNAATTLEYLRSSGAEIDGFDPEMTQDIVNFLHPDATAGNN